MFYTTKITVQQNPFFYIQKDSGGNLVASKDSTFLPNKIDTTIYEWSGGMGCVFKSIETSHPLGGDTRVIYNTYFNCTSVYKRGFRKYECWWTSSQLHTQEDIKNFLNEKIL